MQDLVECSNAAVQQVFQEDSVFLEQWPEHPWCAKDYVTMRDVKCQVSYAFRPLVVELCSAVSAYTRVAAKVNCLDFITVSAVVDEKSTGTVPAGEHLVDFL